MLIDLHAHILAGLDDGPETLEQSIGMAGAMVEVGIDTVTCSSHHYPALGWLNGPEQILPAIALLGSELQTHNIPLRLLPSAEHFYDAELLDKISLNKVQSINDQRYILVEFSTSVLPPNLPEVLFRIRRQGLEPLIAHVERYPVLAADHAQVQVLVDQGYSLQVDAGALSGDFGRAQKKLAWKLLDAGLIQVVASDAHRSADLLRYVPKACALIKKRLGEAALQRLWHDNPQAILLGKSLDDPG